MPEPRAPDGRRRPVPPVFLHIGTMKSGTTYLQNVLIGNKERLASDGHLFAGATWMEQDRAARDVAGISMKDPVFRSEAEGAWRSLAQQMLDHRGRTSIVSMEFLANAGTRQARAATTSLEPAEVHVILTVRDAARTIPSHWQTAVKSKGTTDWQDFRVGVRKAGGPRARLGRWGNHSAVTFRRTHDVSRMLEAWGATVPPDRLHVVTVPRAGADPMLLWQRFAAVIGLAPGLAADVTPANESLGYASTELMRRVNLALSDVPQHDYVTTVRQRLGNHILAQRSDEEARPRLDRATFEFAREWNARTREAVRRSGAQVVGDLDDLPTSPTENETDAVDDKQRPPTDDELLEAAAAAIAGMHRLIDKQRRRVARLDLDVAAAQERTSGGRPPSGSTGPLGAAVAEIADLCRTSIDLRRRIRAR